MTSESPDRRQALRSKWDLRHADADKSPAAVEVLTRNLHLLPAEGLALDLACGLGGNALTLAQQGLDVVAWDISPVAIRRLTRYAAEAGLTNLNAEMRDVEAAPPPPRHFDLIIVSYYLERGLIPSLIDALRPGGLIYYQTFIKAAVTGIGPQNPAFRLDDNELLRLFSGLKLRYYREENRLGEVTQGVRDVAMLVAEKR
ncbi:MAG: SAM-dependent methyltransferase [gamma proteobacterium symbiont of Ctena orbiculata]|uniref:Methyltransferase domain-containing protein n=1 Tax=Candidatus Thiodiazotropha taylori TaxID=2792791 RepID=A0A944QT59_9GAMM|nr:methyltransferase domain-containing protein [Candidatus Thiodiazotropha taylori]PUB90147.1 MAG: SAM-dependent methyltransferase [gamma proteobacterium symbiont of Ctena orbiculata]MBT2988727.1 methyltransferase domain-containing protein [Candidatus Thiodiazotropha taylori]MBT2996706.1 methyltransferase domain-containing protein [Candidatus Thiodiazotropha taylori]MBT3001422.1 methyltransferase domain-containing protein [Candidatus Thiodiazotropha taylori]